jgi:phospholipid/cholesterol/gamma-HCH transport system ATP-binding protein
MRIRKQAGFLFQSAALFDSITVGENVAFPLRRHTNYSEAKITGMVRQKLSQVGLEKDVDKMPNELSGGMRKRVALARAMALGPSILFADEPSSGLDPITSDEIDRLLVNLKIHRNTTLVIVTHNVPSARRVADVIAVLDRGRIAAFGTPDELMRLPNETIHRFMTSVGAA